MALLPAKPQYLRVLHHDARYLLQAVNRHGAYTYWIIPYYLGMRRHPGLWDNSNSQYGVLGIWACAHCGLKIPLRYWLRVALHWRRTQSLAGAWGYSGSQPFKRARGPWKAADFTPAGVASLLIGDEFIHQQPAAYPQPDRNVQRGLAWIHHHFTGHYRSLYQIYNYVRLGLASGLQTFAGHHWYAEFARTLVRRQHRNGSWKGHFIGADRNISTAYALLTLDRGLNPILLSKLQYDPTYAGWWNVRQRDAANFTSWVSNTFETPLNWQVVNFKMPVADWLNSPLLLITGRTNLRLTPADIAKLRQYIQAGGIILASCEGHSRVFQNAMVKAALATVHQRYPVKVLPRQSLLYTIQPWFHLKHNPHFLALGNGVRYLWIIAPMDLGAVWQARQFSRKSCWEIPANLYFYANGKRALSNRLHSLTVPPGTAQVTTHLFVAQIHHAGNWDPEPGAWPRMVRLAAHQHHIGITLSQVLPTQLHADKFSLATLTGTGHFSFTATQTAALGRYLRHGGMLLADAAGGKPLFTNACVKLAQVLFPHQPLQSVPLKSALLTGTFPGGTNVTHVHYRKFCTTLDGRQLHPHLLGVKWHGRWVMVLSQYDITSGFLGTHTWGIRGYSPASAQALADNVLLYARRHGPPMH